MKTKLFFTSLFWASLVLAAYGVWTPALAESPGGMPPGPMEGRHGMGGPGRHAPDMGPRMLSKWRWLPESKQQQLEKVLVERLPALFEKKRALRHERQTMRETAGRFPVDQKALTTQWERVSMARREMFLWRADMMAQVQKIVGKEAWEKMHRSQGGLGGAGPGFRHRRGEP